MRLQLVERCNLIAKLNEFVVDYRAMLDLASTPIPFSLIQMGRSFLFLWVFSMPMILQEGLFQDLVSAEIFIFFLTYGFVGLELVSAKLADPFGDHTNDIQMSALSNAVLAGIENDLEQAKTITASMRHTLVQNNGNDDDSMYHHMSIAHDASPIY